MKPPLALFLLGIFSMFGVGAVRRVDTDLFNALLYQAAGPDAKLLVYDAQASQENIVSAPDARDATSFLAALHLRFKKTTPGALLPVGTAPPSPHRLEQLLSEKEITLVIVPGIFGEFIETRAFEEIFRKTDSIFAKQWKTAASQARQKNPSGVLDSVFDIRTQAEMAMDLEKLIHTASVDDNGKVLLKAVLLNAPRFSLETLGDSASRAQIYVRRLSRFFTILGRQSPRNLVFVGYSRGTITALNMLVQAKRLNESKPNSVEWLSRVKAMVALGGVTFGSDLADEAFRKGSLSQKQLALLTRLSDSLVELLPIPKSAGFLEEAEIVVKNTGSIAANTAAWANFLSDFASLSNDQTMVTTLLGTISSSNREPGARGQFGVMGRVVQTLHKDLGMSAESFGLSHATFFSEYSANIRKAKRLVAELMTGVRELTTASRLSWWRDPKNQLPTEGIRYLTLAAAMIDPKFETTIPLSISQNSSCYDSNSIDYQLLRKNCEDFRLASGIALNDSQVAIHKVHFWPELAALLNPYYGEHKLDASWLGIVATHHWGLALEVVNRELEIKNPFPREALAKAIAASVAYELGDNKVK